MEGLGQASWGVGSDLIRQPLAPWGPSILPAPTAPCVHTQVHTLQTKAVPGSVSC